MNGKAFLMQHGLIMLDCLVAFIIGRLFFTLPSMPSDTTAQRAGGYTLKIVALIIVIVVWAFLLARGYMQM